MFDLLPEPDALMEFLGSTTRGGRRALVEHWKQQREEAVNHVALHMKTLRRPFAEAVSELAEQVLPEFS